MKTIRLLMLAFIALSISTTAYSLSASYTPPEEGKYAFKTVSYEWQDSSRERTVPVKIYYPDEKGVFPMIIFSHGLGGTREGYSYLGTYWASNGYISVHLQHEGSDDSVWKRSNNKKSSMRKAAMDPRNALNRAKDVSFAIDRMISLKKSNGIFKNRVDEKRIGVAGHSFGANTSLLIAGQTSALRIRRDLQLKDTRVIAAIPMSAPVPYSKKNYDIAFADIRIPCFHMTGTLDDSPIGNSKAKDRRVPFDYINGAEQYLITFTGGDHMVFSGRPRQMGNGEKDAIFQDLIKKSTLAFWDACLKGDLSAKKWLSDGGFKTVLGVNGVFETKLK